jgi:hypothetical protein
MKLLICLKCQDVFKLSTKRERSCECGATKGRYLEDGINAVHSGGVPLGFSNPSLVEALSTRPQSGSGRVFTAFVIPQECSTLVEIKEPT